MKHFYLTDEILIELVSRRRAKTAMVLSELFLAGYEGKELTVKEIAEISHSSPPCISRIAKDGELITVFDTYILKEHVKYEINSKRPEGRPAKLYKVPTLRQLEGILGCSGRRIYTIEYSNEVELKQEVAAILVKYSRNREGDFANTTLAKASGMSVNTVKKYTRYNVISTPREEQHTLTAKEVQGLHSSLSAYRKDKNRRGWTYLVVGNRKFAYTKYGALEALEAAGSFEKVIVETKLSSHREYCGAKGYVDRHSVDCRLVSEGRMTLDEYKEKYPQMYLHEHPEHSMLIKGLEGADQILHKRELDEQQRILKEVRYKKL